MTTAEQERLDRDGDSWRFWGPYLAERAWGTVREDYSADGNAWEYFPHDHARSRVFRWNEDGIGGICDEQQRLCFALALWNGRDPILKERLFGLTPPEGNHGEDVKECYYYLDSTPTHSYMRMLYKYPQRAFPYEDLVATNRKRSKLDPEYELLDTGIFAENRYFDLFIEYAKKSAVDILIRIQAVNRGPEAAELDLLPTLWFRNTWSWTEQAARPVLELDGSAVVAEHRSLGRYRLAADNAPAWLFTENETNFQRLYNVPNRSRYVKDGIDDAIVQHSSTTVSLKGPGTKVAAHYHRNVAAGQTETLRLRLYDAESVLPDPFADFDAIFAQRQKEADEFYAALAPATRNPDERAVLRQALAGMLWSKEFYHYDVERWLEGDPTQPPPPPPRWDGRNHTWKQLNAIDIISMPDKWEYPWFAAWDLAFHCITLARVDPEFAKAQLILLGREWYQHPNGQIPAYEYNFGDVNPPVQAWAAWRVYQIDARTRGVRDRAFLERVFHKLLLNFTWWVNRKDSEGSNVFEGGFLGLDNIGVFDRDAMLPTGGHIEQSDGTAWMGVFCLSMLRIALELATQDHVYEDIATKFFEHFLYIANAMNNMVGEGIGLWDDEDEFFYDVLRAGPGNSFRLKVRSVVGLIPLFAVMTIEPADLAKVPEFKRRLEWFLKHRPELAALVSRWMEPGMDEARLLAILRGHRMKRVLSRMLAEDEFLSPHGVRALSRCYLEHPYTIEVEGKTYTVPYEPAESQGELFGGNSNWRGPVWFPINYLIVESLREFHHYYGDDFKVEYPTGSGHLHTLNEIANDLRQRLIDLFTRDANGRRAVFGTVEKEQTDPDWCDYILFCEYFNGDTGAGLGASHQTGWTGLVAELLCESADLNP